MTIKIDHSAPPMLPRTKEPDLSKIVDQDILDIFKNTSVFYGDIINAQLIRTTKELVSALRVRDLENNLPQCDGDGDTHFQNLMTYGTCYHRESENG